MPPLTVSQIEAVVRPVLAGLGYDLVDLEWKPEAGRWVLRAFIDYPPPAPGAAERRIAHDDCARASHSLSAELDVADLIQVAYTLEVSSPGLDRPLKREEDFRRFVGRSAKIRTRRPIPVEGASAGRRNFAGRLAAVEEGKVKIEVDGRVHEIAVADVEKAHLEYEI